MGCACALFVCSDCRGHVAGALVREKSNRFISFLQSDYTLGICSDQCQLRISAKCAGRVWSARNCETKAISPASEDLPLLQSTATPAPNSSRRSRPAPGGVDGTFWGTMRHFTRSEALSLGTEFNRGTWRSSNLPPLPSLIATPTMTRSNPGEIHRRAT